MIGMMYRGEYVTAKSEELPQDGDMIKAELMRRADVRYQIHIAGMQRAYAQRQNSQWGVGWMWSIGGAPRYDFYGGYVLDMCRW